MAAVGSSCFNLQYASAQLKDDKEIALLAFKYQGNPTVFGFLSERLKGDFDVVSGKKERLVP